MAEQGRQRLRRTDRREQILAAATGAFARSGFAATGLNDVAAAAGISRAILYRHFESKTDLYRAVLDRACRRLEGAVSGGPGAYTQTSLDDLVAAADADPDAFRLLFRYAVNEPEFAQEMTGFRTGMSEIAARQLTKKIADPAWADWAARLTPVVAIEGVLAWLDAGAPDPALAAAKIKDTVGAVINTARTT